MSSRRGLISPQLRSAIPVLHFLHGLLKVCFLPLILPICIPLLLHYYYYYLRQNAEKWETVRRKWERDSWLIHRFFTSCAKSMWKAFVTGSAFSEWKKKRKRKIGNLSYVLLYSRHDFVREKGHKILCLKNRGNFGSLVTSCFVSKWALVWKRTGFLVYSSHAQTFILRQHLKYQLLPNNKKKIKRY